MPMGSSSTGIFKAGEMSPNVLFTINAAYLNTNKNAAEIATPRIIHLLRAFGRFLFFAIMMAAQ